VTTARVAALNKVVNAPRSTAPAAQIRQAPADVEDERRAAELERRHAAQAAQLGQAANAEQALLTAHAAALAILGLLRGP